MWRPYMRDLVENTSVTTYKVSYKIRLSLILTSKYCDGHEISVLLLSSLSTCSALLPIYILYNGFNSRCVIFAVMRETYYSRIDEFVV